jgi:hypothetical protein
MPNLRRLNPLLTIATLCILTGALIIIVSWVSDVTAPGPRPHALWRATLPGVDIGLDTSLADIGQLGYIELWFYPHQADDIQPVLRIFGTAALPPMNTTNEQPPQPLQLASDPQLRWA